MIGEVFKDFDIQLYLQPGEEELLSDNPIEGPLLHSSAAWKQGKAVITTRYPSEGLDRRVKVRREQAHDGVGEWVCALKRDAYEKLLSEGHIFCRYDSRGSKFEAVVVDGQEHEETLQRLRSDFEFYDGLEIPEELQEPELWR